MSANLPEYIQHCIDTEKQPVLSKEDLSAIVKSLTGWGELYSEVSGWWAAAQSGCESENYIKIEVYSNVLEAIDRRRPR